MGPPAGNDELEVAEEEPQSIRGEGGSDGLLAMATGDSKALLPLLGCDAMQVCLAPPYCLGGGINNGHCNRMEAEKEEENASENPS